MLGVKSGQTDPHKEAVVELLQQLLQIKTINSDPGSTDDFIKGNELEICNYISDYLKKHGITSQIYKSTDTRASLVARLQSNNPTQKAVAFMAHIDVVGVDKKYWTISDPFKGEIKDNFIYGRGAMDDKGMAATIIQMLIKVKESKLQLKRDVIIILCADEEWGGVYGIQHLVNNHRELFKDVEYVFNEGGQIIREGDKLFLNIQLAEKAICNLIIKAKGESGHSSVPHNRNPIEMLSQAIYKISTMRDTPQLSDITRKFFLEKSKYEKNTELKDVMYRITTTEGEKFTSSCGELSSMTTREAFYYNAMIRNTITTTVVNAGVRFNVIPPVAEATANVRLLPGANINDFIKRIKDYIKMPEIEIGLIEQKVEETPPVSELNGACYEAIVNAAKSVYGESIIAIPFVSTGATDSKFLRNIGVNCYGLLPFVLDPGDFARMHGNDERVGVTELQTGLDFAYGIVKELNK